MNDLLSKGVHNMIPEEAQEAINRMVDAFQAFGVELSKSLIPMVEALTKIAKQYNAVCLECRNPKLKHLALHSKKARVRKKNFNRIIRNLIKG